MSRIFRSRHSSDGRVLHTLPFYPLCTLSGNENSSASNGNPITFRGNGSWAESPPWSSPLKLSMRPGRGGCFRTAVLSAPVHSLVTVLSCKLGCASDELFSSACTSQRGARMLGQLWDRIFSMKSFGPKSSFTVRVLSSRESAPRAVSGSSFTANIREPNTHLYGPNSLTAPPLQPQRDGGLENTHLPNGVQITLSLDETHMSLSLTEKERRGHDSWLGWG